MNFYRAEHDPILSNPISNIVPTRFLCISILAQTKTVLVLLFSFTLFSHRKIISLLVQQFEGFFCLDKPSLRL